MATFNALALSKRPTMQSAYGNLCVAYDKVSMPIGTAAGDTADVLRLPKNARILDFYESHDGGNSAATTANIGLAAVPGGPTTYVDADYFLAAADLNAAGRNRWGNTAVAPILLDGDYFVRIVIAGTTSATAAMDIHVVVLYEFLGNL
jgi:hypothetical protein